MNAFVIVIMFVIELIRFFSKGFNFFFFTGFKPYKITHASDYFQELYDYAVSLIRRYVSLPLL